MRDVVKRPILTWEQLHVVSVIPASAPHQTREIHHLWRLHPPATFRPYFPCSSTDHISRGKSSFSDRHPLCWPLATFRNISRHTTEVLSLKLWQFLFECCLSVLAKIKTALFLSLNSPNLSCVRIKLTWRSDLFYQKHVPHFLREFTAISGDYRKLHDLHSDFRTPSVTLAVLNANHASSTNAPSSCILFCPVPSLRGPGVA